MGESDNDRVHVGANAYLDKDQQRKLWDHIRYLENMEEAAQEIRDDVAERKKLVKADGFDTNMVGVVMKRRKLGKGQSRQADSVVKMYEEALEEYGVKPVEETRRRKDEDDRRTVEQVDEDLHGHDDVMFDPPEPL